MKFVRFDSLENVEDGDKFFVIYPNGVVVLCWYSKRGYFSPEIDYDESFGDVGLEVLPSLYTKGYMLVSKLILEN